MSQPAYLQEPTRSENRLKQIFWPSIRYPQDVDLLATQGFWMCLVLAIASAILLSIGGHPVLGLLIACFFFLGGVGVRQSSIEASACVFVVYLVDLVSATVTGQRACPFCVSSFWQYW